MDPSASSARSRAPQSALEERSDRKYQKSGAPIFKPLLTYLQPAPVPLVLFAALVAIFTLAVRNFNLGRQLSEHVAAVQLQASQLEEQEKTIVELREKIGTEIFIPQISDMPEMQKAMEAVIGVGDSADRPLWPKWLPPENDKKWRQHFFRTRGTRDLLQFSSYRLSPKKFGMAALASTRLREHRQLHHCTWYEAGGEGEGEKGREGGIQGTLHIAYEGDLKESAPYDLHYEAVALICNLTSPTGSGGGHVVAAVDYESFVMFREEGNTTHDIELPTEFQYEIVYCSNAYHDKIIARDVWEWMEFNRVVHKIDHFYVYDAGGVDDDVRSTLSPYIEANLLTITNIREVLLYSIKYWGQPLGNIDCVYRSRFTAKWIMMADVDEYLHVVPPHTLASLLSRHVASAWLTHGSFVWDVRKCANLSRSSGRRPMAVERFRVRESSPFCADRNKYRDAALCLAFWGHRKFFANPRLVDVPGCHELQAEGAGVDLNALTEARHHHVRGLGAAFHEGALCDQTLNPEEIDKESHVWTEELHDMAKFVKECPIGSPKDCYEKAVNKS